MDSILPESLGSFEVVESMGELWSLYWLRWPLHVKIRSDAGVNKPSQLHFGSRTCQPIPFTSHMSMAYSRRTLMPKAGNIRAPSACENRRVHPQAANRPAL